MKLEGTHELAPGVVHQVVGPNGSGKTTLLRALFELCRLGSDPAVGYRRAALLPQVCRSINDIPIEGLLALAKLKVTDWKKFARRHVGAMSSGERQYLLLEAILATRADVMLLDEPLRFLDHSHLRRAIRLIGEACQREAIVVITEHTREWNPLEWPLGCRLSPNISTGA